MQTVQRMNYIVPSISSPLTQGHIPDSELINAISLHDGEEAYHCMFSLESRDTYKEYSGETGPSLGCVWFDFDSKEDAGRKAYEDVKRFIEELDNPLIFFSGGKGFHVGVGLAYTSCVPGAGFNRQAHQLAKQLKADYPTLDTGIYDAGRKFRLPGSKHPKTGLFKTYISPEEILGFDYDYCQAKAKERSESLEWSVPNQSGVKPLKKFTLALTAVPKHIEHFDTPKSNPDNANGNPKPSANKDDSYFQAFERVKGKKCIDRMLSDRAADGQKHYISLRIITDLYNTGVHLVDATKKLQTWMTANNVTDTKPLDTLVRVYNGQADYSFGCQDEIKSAHCSGKCPIFRILKAENRPRVADAPASIVTRDQSDKKTSDRELADQLINLVGANLIRQDRDIFRYANNKWTQIYSYEIDQLKREINRLANNELSNYEINSAYAVFTREIKHVPEGINLHSSCKFAANFQNGTLHAIKGAGPDSRYSLEFRAHCKTDYLVNILPYSYLEADESRNEKFQDMLERVFADDHDIAEKIRCVAQMFGACIMPIFPHLFFLYGPPGTGKSTIMKLCARLITKENMAQVEPCDFNGFNMESMIGKMINMVTDIDTQKPINDSAMKRIEDGGDQRIRRKGIADAYAPIPGIHIYGGQDIPPTLEGTHRAHGRRWTFIEAKKVMAVAGGTYNKDFASEVFEAGSQGILNFALAGLADLLKQGGIYSNPASGVEKLESWQNEADLLGLFIDSIKSGEVVDGNCKLILGSELKMSRTRLFQSFMAWCENFNADVRHYNASKFYTALRIKGSSDKIVHGVRYVTGYGFE